MPPRLNQLSHREQMRQVADAVREAAGFFGLAPTAADYREARRSAANRRRAEQSAGGRLERLERART